MAALLACLPAAGLLAQSPANPAVARSEQRIQELTQKIAELDAAIEVQIKGLADYLATVKDSPDSKSRVSQVKQDFMKDLKKSIDVYRNLRSQWADHLGRPSRLTPEEVRQSTDVLDAKIETRIEQILSVANSFEESDGVKDYQVIWDDGRRGDDRDVRETDASRQARREGSRAAQVEDQVIKGLEESIRQIEGRKVALNSRLLGAASEEQKAAIRDEMKAADEAIARRREQMAGLVKERGAGGQALSSREAFELDQQLDARMQELKSQFRQLYATAAERRQEMARLRSLRAP
jgi:3-methyladenine DNA glycosylase AlkD